MYTGQETTWKLAGTGSGWLTGRVDMPECIDFLNYTEDNPFLLNVIYEIEKVTTSTTDYYFYYVPEGSSSSRNTSFSNTKSAKYTRPCIYTKSDGLYFALKCYNENNEYIGQTQTRVFSNNATKLRVTSMQTGSTWDTHFVYKQEPKPVTDIEYNGEYNTKRARVLTEQQSIKTRRGVVLKDQRAINIKRLIRVDSSQNINTIRQKIKSCNYNYNIKRDVIQDAILNGTKYLFTTMKGTASTGEEGKELQSNFKTYAHVNNKELIELPFIAYRKGKGNDYPTMRFEYEVMATGARKTATVYTQNGDYKYFKVGIYTSGTQIIARFFLFDGNGNEIWLSNSNKEKTLINSANFKTHKFRAISYHSDYSQTDNYSYVLPEAPEHVREIARTKRLVRAKQNEDKKLKRQVIKNVNYSFNTKRVKTFYHNVIQDITRKVVKSINSPEKLKRLVLKKVDYSIKLVRNTVTMSVFSGATKRIITQIYNDSANTKRLVRGTCNDSIHTKRLIKKDCNYLISTKRAVKVNLNYTLIANRKVIKGYSFNANTKRVIRQACNNSASTKRTINKIISYNFSAKRLINKLISYNFKTERKVVKTRLNISHSFNTNRSVLKSVLINAGTNRRVRVKTAISERIIRLIRLSGDNNILTQRRVLKNNTVNAPIKRLVLKNNSLVVNTKRKVDVNSTSSVNTQRLIRVLISEDIQAKRIVLTDYNSPANTRRHVITLYSNTIPTQRLVIPQGIPVNYNFRAKRVIHTFKNAYYKFNSVRIARDKKERDIFNLIRADKVKNDKGQSNIKYESIRTLKGKCYPIKTNIEATPIGLSDKVKFLLITKDKKAIDSDNLIEINGVKYGIDMLIKYSNHREIYLKEL